MKQSSNSITGRILTFAPKRHLNADGFESTNDRMRRVFAQLSPAARLNVLGVAEALLDASRAKTDRQNVAPERGVR